MNMFIILIVFIMVMVSQVYIFVKLSKFYTLNIVVNYTIKKRLTKEYIW